jgi:hypothetical protein
MNKDLDKIDEIIRLTEAKAGDAGMDLVDERGRKVGEIPVREFNRQLREVILKGSSYKDALVAVAREYAARAATGEFLDRVVDSPVRLDVSKLVEMFKRIE